MIEQASLVIGECNWAVKDGSLLGYKLIEGKYYPRDMSVVRATTATRVNADGLVELVPYNLLTYSEDFSNAAYNKIDIQTVTTGITDPNGGTTGVRLIPFVGFNGVVTQSFSTAIGSTYTLTFWIKGNANGVLNVNYNGAVLSPQNNVSYTTQWQQFQYVFTADSNSSQILFGGFFTWSSGQQLDFTFAQLNEGSTALPYQKTETRLNIPRLDYSNGTCPSLLVEPQRTNLLAYSEQFDNSSYWSTYNASITANTTISPSGILNADTIIPSASTGGDVYRLITLNGTYTATAYFKSGTATSARIGYSNGDLGIYNLTNQTIITTGSVTATIEDLGNGWYRCSLTTTITSGAYVAYSSNGTTGQTMNIWGAQLEAGSYPTSYIPTTTASVTRNADQISKTGISSLIGQTEGTMFVDFYVDNIASQTINPVIFSFNAENFIEIFTNGRIIYVDVNGNISINLPSYGLTNGRHKFAIAYNTNDAAFYIDGSLAGTDTSCTPSAKNDLLLGYTDLSYTPEIRYNATALWKTRLSNTQLSQLTTL